MLSSIAARIRCVGAEADEDRAVAGQRPVGDVAPEDLARTRPGRSGRRGTSAGFGSSSALSAFRRPMTASWVCDRQRLPADASCSHCWSSRTAPPSPGAPGGTSDDGRRLDEGRVLGAVDEPGQVEVVVVRPADDLVRERRRGRRAPMTTPRDRSKTTSYARAGQPDDDVVLGRRHRVAVGADERLVEARDARRAPSGRDRRPQFGPEAGHEIDAADRRARLAQRRPRAQRSTLHPPSRADRTRGMRASWSRARRCPTGATPRRVLSTDAGRPLCGRAPRSTFNRSPGMEPDYRLGRAPVASVALRANRPKPTLRRQAARRALRVVRAERGPKRILRPCSGWPSATATMSTSPARWRRSSRSATPVSPGRAPKAGLLIERLGRSTTSSRSIRSAPDTRGSSSPARAAPARCPPSSASARTPSPSPCSRRTRSTSWSGSGATSKPTASPPPARPSRRPPPRRRSRHGCASCSRRSAGWRRA